MFLYTVLQEHEHLTDVIFKGRTAHLASCNYLQEISTNIKTRQSHRSTSHWECLFYRTHTVGCFRLIVFGFGIIFTKYVQ